MRVCIIGSCTIVHEVWITLLIVTVQRGNDLFLARIPRVEAAIHAVDTGFSSTLA
jgi:hypothetical protein